jgi:hypothetical protein
MTYGLETLTMTSHCGAAGGSARSDPMEADRGGGGPLLRE